MQIVPFNQNRNLEVSLFSTNYYYIIYLFDLASYSIDTKLK